jgi:glycogen(starch) synthase
MVKVCIYSPASRGGAGWFVSALTQALGDAGAHVLLVAPEMVPASREPKGPLIARRVLIAGRAGKASLVVRIARTAWRIGSTFPALALARFHHRDYLVTMYDWVPVLVLQFLFLRLIGGRITFVVHDVSPHAWAFPPYLRALERGLYRLSYHLPQRVVSLTAGAHAELARDWGRTVHSHVIPHGAYVHDDPTPLPGDGVVLVFGMLRRNKRILESIEAMRILAAEGSRLRMIIAGEPHVDDLDYWRQCEAALVGLDAHISVEVGFVPEDRVVALVAMSDALLLPYEDFNSQSGVAILGAMAERVIVATRVGGVAELFDNGLQAIPIDSPVNAAGIAAALRYFEHMPLSERRNCAKIGRFALAKKLSWRQIGRRYFDLLAGGDAEVATD